MQEAHFRRADGPLVAEVRSGYAQPGSYTFFLWASGTNEVVQEERGNFLNDDADRYELPQPPEDNNGRIAEAIITLAVTPPISNWEATLLIHQNGNVLATDAAAGTTDQPTVTADLFISLVQDD